MALGVIKVKLVWHEEIKKISRVEKGIFGNKAVEVMKKVFPAEVYVIFHDIGNDKIENYILTPCFLIVTGFSYEGTSDSWFEVQQDDLELVNNALFKLLSDLSNVGWKTIELARHISHWGFKASRGGIYHSGKFIWSTQNISPPPQKTDQGWECVMMVDIVEN